MEHAPPSKVALIADAAPDVGLGHLTRTGAVAAALVARGRSVSCHGFGAARVIERDGLTWHPLEPGAPPPEAGLRLVDSYRMDAAELPADVPLVVMHDRGDPPPNAARVVSVASPETGERWLSGLRHACLRRSFWGLPPGSVRRSLERVLVTTGAGDPGAQAYSIAAAVKRAVPDARVELVIGPQSAAGAPPGVFELRTNDLLPTLRAVDLVVTGAGQTMLEAMAVGCPCIAVVLSDNQRPQADLAAEADAVRVVREPSPHDVENCVRDVAASRDARVVLSRTAQATVDGYGSLRVAFAIDELLG